jgi:hypothetical protein
MCNTLRVRLGNPNVRKVENFLQTMLIFAIKVFMEKIWINYAVTHVLHIIATLASQLKRVTFLCNF